MASQKSRNNPTESRTTLELKKNNSNASKQDTQSYDKTKPKIRFKKAKKISKSIKRMESEISQIQAQMARIGKDLTAVLDLIQTKKVLDYFQYLQFLLFLIRNLVNKWFISFDAKKPSMFQHMGTPVNF